MTLRTLKLGVTLTLGLTMGLALVVTNTAMARVLTMSGEWYMNRGPLVDVPINGGPMACAGVPSTGCVNNLRPLNGGIPAAPNTLNVTGVAPAKFTVGASVFAQAGGTANRQTVPVAGIPTVIQMASQFSLLAPAGTGMNATGPVPGGVASFQANAWSNDPKQAARLGANFTWCPPAGACTTSSSATYGAYGAEIKYTAGANAFGGTMNMMLRDTSVVSVAIGGGKVLHQLVGGTSNPNFGKQVAGGSYANSRLLTLAPGPVHSTFMTATPCTSGFGMPPSPPGCGVITAQGAQTLTLPGSQNHDWGMPWTTGTVFVKNLAGGAGDPATTFSVMGSDARTPMGKGQITLVAGATTERIPSGNHFGALEVIRMNFSAGPQATPMLSAPAIATVVVLMLLLGGYLARGRFTTKGIEA